MGLFTSRPLSTAGTTKPRKSYSGCTDEEIRKVTNTLGKYFTNISVQLITSIDLLEGYICNIPPNEEVAIYIQTDANSFPKTNIVGISLYYPEGGLCYIPIQHLVPMFNTLYKNQITCKELCNEFEYMLMGRTIRLISSNTYMELFLLNKHLRLDPSQYFLCFYYDIITTYQFYEEPDIYKGLKYLYTKHILHSNTLSEELEYTLDPKTICNLPPKVAAPYISINAKIIYELYKDQINKHTTKAENNHITWFDVPYSSSLAVSKLLLYYNGIYLDKHFLQVLTNKYTSILNIEQCKLQKNIDNILQYSSIISDTKMPFTDGESFSVKSVSHVAYLVYDILGTPLGTQGRVTTDEFLRQLHEPVVDQILYVRKLHKFISYLTDTLNKLSSHNYVHFNYESSKNIINTDYNEELCHLFRSSPSSMQNCDITDHCVTLSPYSYLLDADNNIVRVESITKGQKFVLHDGNATLCAAVQDVYKGDTYTIRFKEI